MDLATYLTAISGATGATFLVTWAVLRAAFGTGEDAEVPRARWGPMIALGIGVIFGLIGLWTIGGGKADMAIALLGAIQSATQAMGIQNVLSSAGAPV